MIGQMLFLVLAATLSRGDCSGIRHDGFGPGPTEEFRALFRDTDLGFAVEIPEGLIGHGSVAPAPLHGFQILTDEADPGSIAFLSYDTGGELLDDITETETGYMTTDVRVDSVTRQKATMGDLTAWHVRVVFHCGNTRRLYVSEKFVAVSADGARYHLAQLTSPYARYARDRATLDRMLGTWRSIPVQ